MKKGCKVRLAELREDHKRALHTDIFDMTVPQDLISRGNFIIDVLKSCYGAVFECMS